MTQPLDHDTVSLWMNAAPDDIFAAAAAADVIRTPEFRPEILECTWLDGATGPGVGVRFEARGKVPNRPA